MGEAQSDQATSSQQRRLRIDPCGFASSQMSANDRAMIRRDAAEVVQPATGSRAVQD
jgi:hypothetical protein